MGDEFREPPEEHVRVLPPIDIPLPPVAVKEVNKDDTEAGVRRIE